MASLAVPNRENGGGGGGIERGEKQFWRKKKRSKRKKITDKNPQMKKIIHITLAQEVKEKKISHENKLRQGQVKNIEARARAHTRDRRLTQEKMKAYAQKYKYAQTKGAHTN